MSRRNREPIRAAEGGGVELRLPADVRDGLRRVVGQLRDLYASDEAADDPAIARLYPPAYLDDPGGNLAFDELTAAGLRDQRFASMTVVERTIDANRLDADEAEAWLRTLNDARLVLGVRLEITEENEAEDFSADPETAATFELYAMLSAIVELLVQALGDPVA